MRFEFEAREALALPPGRSANTLRGALGMHLPEALFAPRSDEGISGMKDAPRPFVLRVPEVKEARLSIRVHAFREGLFEPFQNAFAEVKGLGPHRVAVQLVGAAEEAPVEVELTPGPAAEALLVEFLTPMELKFEDATLREPRFDALFARARDRVSALCGLYQGGPPEADYRGLGEAARGIALMRSRIEQVEVERRSSRTGQRHGIGGFMGEAEYSGELGALLPWLKAAEWTGVGRHTVWGNGALRATEIPGDGIGR